MSDPWKHRSKGMTCATCMWSVIKVSDSMLRHEDNLQKNELMMGGCRTGKSIPSEEKPPGGFTPVDKSFEETAVEASIHGTAIRKVSDNAETPTPQPQLGRCRRRAPTMNGYPAVFENDWCGDHKLDENKL